MGKHLVVGTGAIGTRLAARLAREGREVVAVSRHGRPAPLAAAGLEGLDAVDWRAADASDPAALAHAAHRADVLYNCASPRYHRWARDWPPMHAAMLAAASAAGATLVTLSNLYGYGPVPHAMAESDPLAARTRRGAVRAAMWQDALAAHERGELRATEIRASDFFGPGVTANGVLGDRVVPRLLDHRTILALGDPDAPHSWTYVDDVVEALRIAGSDERALGRPWHAPTCAPVSVREAVRLLSCAAELPTPPVRRLPWSAVGVAGIFTPDLRGVRELAYQFDRPFVVDSREFQSVFGTSPTPMPEAMRATIAWWRDRRGFPLAALEEPARR